MTPEINPVFFCIMKISVLCKVVDNYGDIGVAFRLVKQLKNISAENEINLIVDDLSSFNRICNTVNENLSNQSLFGINVYNWNENDFCYEEFSKNDGEKLQIILELFQCGRPDWMEKILFEEKLNREVQIIMIDYLTAEKYADDFHCLESLTRSKKVKKVNFMPGYTDKTGGLIIDDLWKDLPVYNPEGNILLFTYEREWSAFLQAWNRFHTNMDVNDLIEKKLLIAQGRGCNSVLEAIEANQIEDKEEMFEVLPYYNQDEWDLLLQQCSVLFIRGEESMSRACLSGIPFIWHAYPQSDEYQLVKVKALLDRMKPYFDEEDFDIISRLWIIVNSPYEQDKEEEETALFLDFFARTDRLVKGYQNFAIDLRKNGDLCANLMTFINKKCII